MKKNLKTLLMLSAAAVSGLFSACSLEEENPLGYTMDDVAVTKDGYQALINNCYFGMERYLYGGGRGSSYYMPLTEADTDLWTYSGNIISYQDYFWFGANATVNLDIFNDIWNVIYDGIGACNLAIAKANLSPYTGSELNALLAEARFMRAVYYFNAVEQVGAVYKLTEPAAQADNAPVRTEPLTIYRDIIIPDLQFAAEWLAKGDDATTTRPTKKAAYGFLAKAALQTYAYGTTEFLATAAAAAKELIDDCEAGGGKYGAYMYPDFADVFKESNNYLNKEALWKHRWHKEGSSQGNYRMNQNDQLFMAPVTKFGARQNATKEANSAWDGSRNAGWFMPTQHLLSLFVQADGTLDPRFHASFMTSWNANQDYEWDADAAANFRKAPSIVGTRLHGIDDWEGNPSGYAANDLAIKFVMPQDPDYADEIAKRATSPYLLVDYKDVYDDAKKNVIMTYNGKENLLKDFYPSLSKHNSSNYNIVRYDRLGNQNATFIMRMSEIYLIAAELDIYLNGGSKAMGYINKVRQRAGAKPLTGTATIRTVLDERGRELCGEYCRFFDLKRTGMFKDASYLQATHPDLAQYFKPEYALRPIPRSFINVISNGDMWQNPGYR